MANPIAAILSAAMMLEWLGERNQDDSLKKAAQSIDASVQQVLRNGQHRTADIGGNSSLSHVGDDIVAALMALEG